MSHSAVLTVRIWGGKPGDPKPLTDELTEVAPMIAPAMEVIAKQCAQGYVAGQIVGEDFNGWWEIHNHLKTPE